MLLLLLTIPKTQGPCRPCDRPLVYQGRLSQRGADTSLRCTASTRSQTSRLASAPFYCIMLRQIWFLKQSDLGRSVQNKAKGRQSSQVLSLSLRFVFTGGSKLCLSGEPVKGLLTQCPRNKSSACCSGTGCSFLSHTVDSRQSQGS